MIITKDGETVSKNTLNPEVLLPGTRKTFVGSWEVPEYGQFDGRVEFTFGSMQNMVASDSEAILAAPRTLSLFVLAVVIWTAVYLYPKRRNIRAALHAIFND